MSCFFPSSASTGYTCADLFGQTALLEAGMQAALRVARATAAARSSLSSDCRSRPVTACINFAVVIADGAILGIVPKQFIPNYKEFYESRWFNAAMGREPRTIEFGRPAVPFGIDLLFPPVERRPWWSGCEICEDLWMPIPPSSVQAIAGANLLLNLSASNETIGKSRYRTDLVVGQSGRCIAAYAYAARADRNRRPTWSSAAIA